MSDQKVEPLRQVAFETEISYYLRELPTIMTLNQLRIFDVVAKHSNLTLAAHEMRISQPSISKQLKALQDDYGVRFYTRGIQGIELTEEGRRFWNAVRPILFQIDDLKSAVRGRNGKQRVSSLRIAAGESPSVSLIPKLLKAFKQTHPEVQLFLRTNDALTIEQMVANKAVEFAIATNASTDPHVTSEQFAAAQIAAVVASGNPLAKQKSISQKDLSAIPVITKVGRRICNHIEEQLGIRLNVVLECESVEAVKAAVKTGLGMGFQYRDAVKSDLRNGHLSAISLPILKKLRVNWFILCRKDDDLSANAKDFLALLRSGPNHQVEQFSREFKTSSISGS
jgi:DNA-binding transcriptional LysR family regulator